jgi:hypothetical protein
VEIEDMTIDALLIERDRIGGCLDRATDTLSQMILNGRLKAIYREIEKRHLSAVAAGRI